MVPGLILLFVAFVLFFSYENYPTHFTETASAIRAVWSGSCRLSCRRPSIISGYSEINPANQAGTAPISSCVCESCPCHHIENVLRHCSPATELYSNIVYALFTSLHEIFSTILNFLAGIFNLLQCRNHCQMPMAGGYLSPYQLPPLSPTGVEEPKKRKSKMSLLKESLSKISRDRSSKTSVTAQPGSSRDGKGSMRISSSETLTPTKIQTRDCNKCMQKGKTCINECPRAKKYMAQQQHGPVGSTPVVPDKQITSNKTQMAMDKGSVSEDLKKSKCPKCYNKMVPCVSDCPKNKGGINDKVSNPIQLYTLNDKVENGQEQMDEAILPLKIDIGIQFPEGILKRSCCLGNETCASGCPKRKGGQGPDSETNINRYLNWSEEITIPQEFMKFTRCFSGKCISGCSKSNANKKPLSTPNDNEDENKQQDETPEETIPENQKCPRCGAIGRKCPSTCPRFQPEVPVTKQSAPIPSTEKPLELTDDQDPTPAALDGLECLKCPKGKRCKSKCPELQSQDNKQSTSSPNEDNVNAKDDASNTKPEDDTPEKPPVKLEPTQSEHTSQQTEIENIGTDEDLDRKICTRCVAKNLQCKPTCSNFYFDITLDVTPSRTSQLGYREGNPISRRAIDNNINGFMVELKEKGTRTCPRCLERGACKSYCPNMQRKSDVVIKIASNVSIARDIEVVQQEIDRMFDQPDVANPWHAHATKPKHNKCCENCPNRTNEDYDIKDHARSSTTVNTFNINTSSSAVDTKLCPHCSRYRYL